MNWFTFGFLAAASYGFYNFFTKLSADKLSAPVVAMIMSASTFVIATIVAVAFRMNGQPVLFNRESLLFPLVAGLFAGFAEIFYIVMFQKGAPISLGNPLVTGGTIIVAVVLGLVILREPISVIKAFGVFLVLVGLVMLARK